LRPDDLEDEKAVIPAYEVEDKRGLPVIAIQWQLDVPSRPAYSKLVPPFREVSYAQVYGYRAHVKILGMYSYKYEFEWLCSSDCEYSSREGLLAIEYTGTSGDPDGILPPFRLAPYVAALVAAFGGARRVDLRSVALIRFLLSEAVQQALVCADETTKAFLEKQQALHSDISLRRDV
jgi:hypothetical protein